MHAVFSALIAWISSTFRTRAALQLEILALRHQLAIYQRSTKRRRIRTIHEKMPDEYGVLLDQLFRNKGCLRDDVTGVVVVMDDPQDRVEDPRLIAFDEHLERTVVSIDGPSNQGAVIDLAHLLATTVLTGPCPTRSLRY